jgi:hypothetical protein
MKKKQFPLAITLLALYGCDSKHPSLDADKADHGKPQAQTQSVVTPDRQAPKIGSNNPPNPLLSSASMLDVLRSQKPTWLNIGEPFQVTAEQEPPNNIRVRNSWRRSGAEQVIVNGKVVKIEGSTQTVTWASISPNGSLILIEKGDSAEVCILAQDGSTKSSDTQIPRLNFGDKNRWFLTRWMWISDSEVLSAMNEQTPDGDQIASSALYHYSLSESKLTKVLLPDKFIDLNDPHLEIVELAGRAVHLRTAADGQKGMWITIPDKGK